MNKENADTVVLGTKFSCVHFVLEFVGEFESSPEKFRPPEREFRLTSGIRAVHL